MKLHHTKHHQAYVNGLNAAEESYAKAKSPKEQIALQAALKFNGGGMCCILYCLYLLSMLASCRTHKSLFVLDQPCPRPKLCHVSLFRPQAIQRN